MADYPNSIYDPRTKENDPAVEYKPEETTKIFAEDITKLDDEVKATQTELGTNPKGAFATVKAWLEALARKASDETISANWRFSGSYTRFYDDAGAGVATAEITVDADDTLDLLASTPRFHYGMLIVHERGGSSCIVHMGTTTWNPTIVSDPQSRFSVTKDTSNKTNFYRDTDNSNRPTMQNKHAMAKTYRLFIVGSV